MWNEPSKAKLAKIPKLYETENIRVTGNGNRTRDVFFSKEHHHLPLGVIITNLKNVLKSI